MRITNIHNYAEVLFTKGPYLLVPAGLMLRMLGMKYPPEPIAFLRGYEVPREHRKRDIAKDADWKAPANYSLDRYDPPNYWLLAGKGLERVSILLFLVRTGIDHSDILVRSAAAVGAVAVCGGSIAEPKLKDWISSAEHQKMVRSAIEIIILAMNAGNILAINGPLDFNVADLTQKVGVGSSMLGTLLLTLFVQKK